MADWFRMVQGAFVSPAPWPRRLEVQTFRGNTPRSTVEVAAGNIELENGYLAVIRKVLSQGDGDFANDFILEQGQYVKVRVVVPDNLTEEEREPLYLPEEIETGDIELQMVQIFLPSVIYLPMEYRYLGSEYENFPVNVADGGVVDVGRMSQSSGSGSMTTASSVAAAIRVRSTSGKTVSVTAVGGVAMELSPAMGYEFNPPDPDGEYTYYLVQVASDADPRTMTIEARTDDDAVSAQLQFGRATVVIQVAPTQPVMQYTNELSLAWGAYTPANTDLAAVNSTRGFNVLFSYTPPSSAYSSYADVYTVKPTRDVYYYGASGEILSESWPSIMSEDVTALLPGEWEHPTDTLASGTEQLCANDLASIFPPDQSMRVRYRTYNSVIGWEEFEDYGPILAGNSSVGFQKQDASTVAEVLYNMFTHTPAPTVEVDGIRYQEADVPIFLYSWGSNALLRTFGMERLHEGTVPGGSGVEGQAAISFMPKMIRLRRGYRSRWFNGDLMKGSI